MSEQYKGLLLQVDANKQLSDGELEAIIREYPSCYGWATTLTNDKTGESELLMAAEVSPPNWHPRDIKKMKAQFGDTPDMIEYFGNLPPGAKKENCQPFTLISDPDTDKAKLVCFITGDYESKEEGLSGAYIVYRDSVQMIIDDLYETCDGDVAKIMVALNTQTYKKLLSNMWETEGTIFILADTGMSGFVSNQKENDTGWGTVFGPLPETPVAEAIKEEPTKARLSLKEQRALKAQKEDAAKGVHHLKQTIDKVPQPSPMNGAPKAQSTIEHLKTSVASGAFKPNGPQLIKLPNTIRSVEEAKNGFWHPHFGSLPNDWKIKNEKNEWVPNYSVGFPYDRLAKNSRLRQEYNPDGSPKTELKGFAALDARASGTSPEPSPASGTEGKIGPAPAKADVPIIGMPVQVRDRLVAAINNLDVKSKPIMSPEEAKSQEEKRNSFFAQTGVKIEDFHRWPEHFIDMVCRTYPDAAKELIVSLRFHHIMTWKPAAKKEEPAPAQVIEPVAEDPTKKLSLKEQRALRRAASGN